MSRIRPLRLSRREIALVSSAQAATLLQAAERLEDAADDGHAWVKTGPEALWWAGRRLDDLANAILRRSRLTRKGAK